MENNFLKLFEAAKWGDTIDNQALATVHRTLVDLPSCNQEEDFTHNYSYALLVFGMTSSNSNNNIVLAEKFLDETLFCDTVRGAALQVLCENNYYGNSLEYLDLLIEQVNNINSDNVDSDVVYTSVTCLGQCAYKHNSTKALTCLYDKFCEISAVPRRENELYGILEVLYDAMQYAVWGSDYSVKERHVTFGGLRFPEDASPKLMELVKKKIREKNHVDRKRH